MKNGEALREMADEGLALWLANRIDCQLCPVVKECDKSEDKSCSQRMFEWLQSDYTKK